MMLLHVFNHLYGLDSLHHSLDLAFSSVPILAQQTDVDILRDFQKNWNNIVQTGQLAAFFIGLVVGWGLKSLLP